MTDAVLALIVASAALALALIRLSRHAMQEDASSPQRLVAELRLAQFAALVLVLTAGVYIGFALAHAPASGSGLDVALGVGFLVLASVAVTQDPGLALTLLAAAFAGQAVVDLQHAARLVWHRLCDLRRRGRCGMLSADRAPTLGERFAGPRAAIA